MKKLASLIILFCVMLEAVGQTTERPMHNYIPPDGYVPNERTAVRVAEAVLIPIYGQETVEKERPFTAVLRDEVWIVRGKGPKDTMTAGGVALVEISKKDGRILRVTHGK